MMIFLAGHIGREIPDEFIKYRAPYVLQTFWDMRFWDQSLVLNAIQTPDVFFLDSGAFSFMNSVKDKVDFNSYLTEYAKFINCYHVDHYFELDLDTIIGVKETRQMTDRLEDMTGKQCIPVFHACRGMDGWRQMLKQYSYVAIGASGITPECRWVKNDKILLSLVQMAHASGVKVHGLGYTRLSNINDTQIPFDSVDSSACLSGGRFATVYKFTENRLISKSIKGKSKGYKILNDHNIREWIKMARYKAGIKDAD